MVLLVGCKEFVASNGNIGLAGQTSPSAQLHINNLGSDG